MLNGIVATIPVGSSECSVHSILYDLYDAANDDNLNLGFTPIYDVLVNDERNTAALTSIFSVIKPLKDNVATQPERDAIDALVARQNIDPITDIYGDSQISNNPGTVDQLPVYLRF